MTYTIKFQLTIIPFLFFLLPGLACGQEMLLDEIQIVAARENVIAESFDKASIGSTAGDIGVSDSQTVSN